MDPKVNDEFHKWLQAEYAQVKDVTVTRGKRHVYLGMTLDYSTEGEVKVDMVDYVKEMVSEFPEELKKIRSAYPANGHLFDTNKGSKLDDLRADIFHAVVTWPKHCFSQCEQDLISG